jgi:hypothetical protein
MNPTKTGIIVIKHHRDFETTLLKIGRQFLLVRFVVKGLVHHMVFEVPFTPIKLLVCVKILAHSTRDLVFNHVNHLYITGIEFHAGPCQSHTEATGEAVLHVTA